MATTTTPSSSPWQQPQPLAHPHGDPRVGSPYGGVLLHRAPRLDLTRPEALVVVRDAAARPRAWGRDGAMRADRQAAV